MYNKRYLVFAGPHCYASGGMADLIGGVDEIAEASFLINPIKHDWVNILDLLTGEEVEHEMLDTPLGRESCV